jgi:hypothetical protein
MPRAASAAVPCSSETDVGRMRAKAAPVPDLTGRSDIKLNRQLKLPVSRLVLMWLQPRGD